MPRVLLPMIMSMTAVLLAAFADGGKAPQSARTPVDVSKVGPQVGARVPDFTLKDQYGKSWTLQSVLGPNGAMLVFYRSADW